MDWRPEIFFFIQWYEKKTLSIERFAQSCNGFKKPIAEQSKIWPVWKSYWPGRIRPCPPHRGLSAAFLGRRGWDWAVGPPPSVTGWSRPPHQKTARACPDPWRSSSWPGPPESYGSIWEGYPTARDEEKRFKWNRHLSCFFMLFCVLPLIQSKPSIKETTLQEKTVSGTVLEQQKLGSLILLQRSRWWEGNCSESAWECFSESVVKSQTGFILKGQFTRKWQYVIIYLSSCRSSKPVWYFSSVEPRIWISKQYPGHSFQYYSKAGQGLPGTIKMVHMTIVCYMRL